MKSYRVTNKRIKSGKKLLCWVFIAVGLCIILGLLFGIIYHNNKKPKELPFQGPVAAFGLAPSNTGVTLLSEEASFTYAGDGYYTAQLQYKIKTAGESTFFIPYADYYNIDIQNKKNADPELYAGKEPDVLSLTVNGENRDITLFNLPKTRIHRPDIYSEQNNFTSQSVFFNREGEENQNQPEDTFSLLQKEFTAGNTSYYFNTNTPWQVYDLSSAVVSADTASFEITGPVELCMAFGENLSTEFRCGYGKAVQYYLQAADKQNKQAALYYLALPLNTAVKVAVSGREIEPITLSAGQFLTEKLQIPGYKQASYIRAVSQKLTLQNANQPLTVINTSAKELNYNENMLIGTFSLKEPGEYNITIAYTAVGESGGNKHLLQYIDSPSSMWQSAGERKIAIHLPEKQVLEYPVQDGVFHFNYPKKGSVPQDK